jgi:tetratricopeptide (TPR) repeat protein
MLSASHTLKSSANAQFSRGDYGDAITTYDRAMAELPSYLDFELAVLQSNIAACYVRLEQWREAVEACERGLGGLERLEGGGKGGKKGTRNGEGNGDDVGKKEWGDDGVDLGEKLEEEGQVVELPDDADEEELQAQLKKLNMSDERKADVKRIRIKLLLRRARARSSLTPPSWSHLAGAVEDYKLLASPDYMAQLPAADQKTVRRALVELPPKVDAAKQKEVGEMMGKLKDLGNGILKPFGLSTDMFKMTQDPNTGGWSMAFDQGGGKGGGNAAGG